MGLAHETRGGATLLSPTPPGTTVAAAPAAHETWGGALVTPPDNPVCSQQQSGSFRLRLIVTQVLAVDPVDSESFDNA